jgi:hypothetical protein
VIRARRMRWIKHIACMGEMRHAYNILVRKPEGKISGDLDIEQRMILKLILKK